MATIYVDDGGDDSDGTTWAKAYTSVMNAAVLGAAAGTEILIGSDHKETGTSAIAITFTAAFGHADPIRLISTNRSTGAAEPGAEIEVTGGVADISLIASNLYVYGVTIDATDDLAIGQYNNCITMEACTLQVTDILSLGYTTNTLRFIGCTFDSKDTGLYPMNIGVYGTLMEFRNCVFAASGGTPTGRFTNLSTDGGELLFDGCDLSPRSGDALVAVGSDANAGGKSNSATFRRCKFPTSYEVIDTAWTYDNGCVLVEACDDGTITVPPLMEYYSYRGTVKADLSHYRTGGADDGVNANAYSWAMVATASHTIELYATLRSLPLTVWEEPKGSISGATARGLYQTTRCAPLAAPADIAADAASTWNGADVGTKQKLSVTLSNGSTLTVYFASDATMQNDEVWMEVIEPDQVGGPITAYVYLAKAAGDTIYVDPKLEIT